MGGRLGIIIESATATGMVLNLNPEAASLGYLVGIPRPGKQLVPFPYMYC